MHIDARSASRGGRTYGFYEVAVDVLASRTTALSYTIWMTKLDTAHAVSVPSPTTAEMIVTTPRLPGLELRIPAGTVIRDEWDLRFKNGLVYTFPNSLQKTLPAQAALVGMRDRLGNKVTLVRNSSGDLTQLVSPHGRSLTFTYDAAGRRTSVTFPNGVVTGYGYDAANRLTSLTFTNGGTTLGDLSYTYDAAGNRTAMGGSLAATVLPAAVTSATVDAANRLTQWDAATPTYDLAGNLTSDGVNTYTWDARNQLTAISGGTTASFTYDPLGRRASRAVNGTVTRYLYDGLNGVQELDPRGRPRT